ncbi:MAG: hypothetical protein Q7R41_12200 [Phycisphaerales bacterium]|nr:hypothetical protein [Phycisphaerales bacterium]
MSKAMWSIVLASVLVSWTTTSAQTTVDREATRITTQENAERLPDMMVGTQEASADLLRRRVASVDWTDKTFEEVLDWVRDQGEGRVNIVAKWGPLGIESVTRETPVNLKLNNSTIAEVLNEVLDQLSEDGQIHYRGVGNKLTISTRQDFEKKLYVRVYNIADLLFEVPNFGQDAPLIDLQNAGKGGGGSGGGGGSSQSVFQGAGGSGGSQRGQSGQQAEQQNELRLTKLRQLIEATIAPETWDLSTGTQTGSSQTPIGGRGRIRVINTSLVVLNTIEVQEMIAGKFSFSE